MIWSGKMCVTSVNHTPYGHREVQFRVAIQTREEKILSGLVVTVEHKSYCKKHLSPI